MSRGRKAKAKDRILGFTIVRQATSTGYKGAARKLENKNKVYFLCFSLKWNRERGSRREGLRVLTYYIEVKKDEKEKNVYCLSNPFQCVEKN